MQRYAELTTCRREFLLRYFGEDYSGPCGNCDNDSAGTGTRREVA
jgi:ATP-dependent DNA helicase RecQ